MTILIMPPPQVEYLDDEISEATENEPIEAEPIKTEQAAETTYDQPDTTFTEETNQPVDNDSEEALEAYMSRLMERVRGENPNAPMQAEGLSTTVDSHSPEEKIAAEVEVVDKTPKPLPVKKTPQPVGMLKDIKSIKREGSLPQRTGNYEALRELANSTTREAISTHTDKVSRDNVWSKFLVAAVGVITGALLIYSASAQEALHFWAGCICIALGSYWALGAIRICVKSAKCGAPNKMPSKKSPMQSAKLPTPKADA